MDVADGETKRNGAHARALPCHPLHQRSDQTQHQEGKDGGADEDRGDALVAGKQDGECCQQQRDAERRSDIDEARLATAPVISVTTITMEGSDNGAPHPPAAAYADKFAGPYAHREVGGGVGHNLPQEAPDDFARAVLDVMAGTL